MHHTGSCDCYCWPGALPNPQPHLIVLRQYPLSPSLYTDLIHNNTPCPRQHNLQPRHQLRPLSKRRKRRPQAKLPRSISGRRCSSVHGPVSSLPVAALLRLLTNTPLGAGGIVAGIAGSIARESSPVTGGFVSGVQWFALGSTFWGTCTVLRQR